MRLSIRPHQTTKKIEPVDLSQSIGSLGEAFKGLGNFIELVSEMAEKGQKEVERTGEIKTPSGKAMYGLSVKIGSAGIPKVEHVGNIVRETEKGPVVEEIREPFVDIFEETEDTLEVIAELPGVDEKDISYEIKDDVLILNASGDSRKYNKEMLLPYKVALINTGYKNGVFRLTLKKQKE